MRNLGNKNATVSGTAYIKSTCQGRKVQFFGCKIHPLHPAFGGKSKTPAKNKVGMPEK